MRRVAALSDVPDEALKTVIRDFNSEGATVTSVLQDDGKWTVVAMFLGKSLAKEDVLEQGVALNASQSVNSGRA